MKITGPYAKTVESGIVLACRKLRLTVPDRLRVKVRARTRGLALIRKEWAWPNKLAKPDGWAVAEVQRVSVQSFEIIAAANPRTGVITPTAFRFLNRHEPARVVLMSNKVPYSKQDAMMKKAGLWE